MKMGPYEKLHLANNLDALDLLAKRDCDVRKLKFQHLCNGLSKLYKTSQLNVLDQEMTYILLARYLNLYNHLLKTQPDKKFVEVRFGSEYSKVLMQFEEIRKSLKERYAAREAEATHVAEKPVVEENKKEIVMEQSKRIFTGEFITCQQLFSALQNNYNVLLVDARPDTDFTESRIDHRNCINVPDQCITSGLSANALGKRLPESTQKVWELRESYDVIILFDWNTSSDNVGLTKLNKLRSALVDWDLNRNYKEPPVILNGGYLELLQMYPTICINPLVYLFQKNNELDELLELDNIKYPTETDNKGLVMGVPEETEDANIAEIDENETPSKEILMQQNMEILLDVQNVMKQLQQEQEERAKINKMCEKENNINNIANFKRRVSDIDVEIIRLQNVLEELDKQNEEVKKRFKLKYLSELEENEAKEEIKETIDKVEENDPEKLKDIINEERNRELRKARALKPKKQESRVKPTKKVRPTEKPTINRANKPSSHGYSLRPRVEPVGVMTSGLVGLKNIRNTCYMNTLIQCLRNIPTIMHLFCKGTYTKYKIRNPAAIVHETAGLVRELWTKSLKHLEPYEFYNKVCQLEPNYRLGNHEDCMEFFLFLLNQLAEDCCYDVTLPPIMTPKQRAWYNQFEGKNSVFVDFFYHQIRIKQTCPQCGQKTYKFEIESTFMLPVPDHDFNLDQLMHDYMADYVIPEYCCAKCKKPVINKKEICYEPRIMVLVLKRQLSINGSVSLRKIEAKAHFQKKNFKVGNGVYQLNAIAMHSGDLNFGHYTAAALTSKGWFEFNDEIVRPININDESLKVKACAFFYSMCDGKD